MTGCSCGGKSTLLNALGECGYATISEPGRRIVSEETARGGAALPWRDLRAFALRALEMARSDLEAAQGFDSYVFFDRGLIDAAVALEHSGGPSVRELMGKTRAYARLVFLFPPWQELFVKDAERKHDFDAAVQEYDRICRALDSLGYNPCVMPKVSARERVEFVLAACGAS